MSAPSGYNVSVWVFDTRLDFKSVSVRETSTQIDSTSKFNPDGTINEGYSDTDGDVGTLFIDIDEVIKNDSVLADISFFQAGESYINTGYSVDYSGVGKYSGSSFYVSAVDVSATTPGESRVRFSFQSKGVYNKL